MWRFGPFLRSVDDLEPKLRRLNLGGRIVDNRAKFPIVLIDDKDFTPINNLQRYNFNITHFSDIQSIDVVSRYPVILCDLLGVGLSFGPRLQGTQVIREIKKNFPDKFVIAYTGGGSSEVSEAAISFADQYLKKDADLEDWCEILDTANTHISNPVTVWRKLRHTLLDAGATPYQVARLEDSFVQNVLGRLSTNPRS
jgi:DNA-binding NarL/FixJ family response regulator